MILNHPSEQMHNSSNLNPKMVSFAVLKVVYNISKKQRSYLGVMKRYFKDEFFCSATPSANTVCTLEHSAFTAAEIYHFVVSLRLLPDSDIV